MIKVENILWSYSDEVWHRCGDQSTDYNHYTKRILFNAAYAATELFLLTDQSHNKHSTWKFLERRLEDIESVGKAANDLTTVVSAAGNGLLSMVGMFREPDRYQHPIS